MVLTSHSLCYPVCDLLACSTAHICCQSRPFKLTSDVENVQTVPWKWRLVAFWFVWRKYWLTTMDSVTSLVIRKWHSAQNVGGGPLQRWKWTEMLESRIIFPDGLKITFFFFVLWDNSCSPAYVLQPTDPNDAPISACYKARTRGLASMCNQ